MKTSLQLRVLEAALATQQAAFRREALRNLWLRETARMQQLVWGQDIWDASKLL
jgi:hypothetical protein